MPFRMLKIIFYYRTRTSIQITLTSDVNNNFHSMEKFNNLDLIVEASIS